MDEATRRRYGAQSKELRVKIKSWEVEYYNSHDGRKPGRGDIKSSGMNLVYKEYQKLRDILDGKISCPPPMSKASTSGNKENRDSDRKRKSPDQPSQTPSTKRFCIVPAETPSSRQYHALNPLAQFTPSADHAGVDALEATTPSLSRKLFSPVVPTSIGPTPQRDGRVLGLFDALPFKDAEIDSPCKPNRTVRLSEVISAGRQGAGEATPRSSKRASDIFGASNEEDRLSPPEKLGRTPSSRHKRHKEQVGTPSSRGQVLTTPLKAQEGYRVAKTPGTSSSSKSRLQFQTPAFLRRVPMSQINEINSAYKSPEPIRLPRKPLMRGLSSVVADLRKLQEAELDDDLDALREMESGHPPVAKASATSQPPRDEATTTGTELKMAEEEDIEASILAEDVEKQNLGLLGGFDDEGLYDSLDEAQPGLDRNGQPLKVYKKKGQKRTTRKSNMRPVRTKRHTSSKIDDGGDDGNAIPPSTTQTHTEDDNHREEEDPALLSGSEFAASDDEDELSKDFTTKTTSKSTTRKAPTKKVAGGTANAQTKPEGVVKKAARKVNELAHANFKRLKLRNNGAKGGPGHNSRFRRRR